jgi:hypothetical protein
MSCSSSLITNGKIMLTNKLHFTLVLCLFLFLWGCDKNYHQKQEVAKPQNTAVGEPKVTLTSENYPYSQGDAIPALAYIEHNEVYNAESVIPPQCYNQTNGDKNPCYACHQSYTGQKERPNMMGDGSLQGEYQFSDLGLTNHWKNLFVDRRPFLAKMSDESIKNWITQDNYSAFIQRQKEDPNWQGEITPLRNLAYPEQAFDLQGLARDGSHWVAYNYKPFPSTFWPTNGSTGDAMIRLPAQFRQLNGQYSASVYFTNLALVELALKQKTHTSISAVSEIELNTDLNGDGILKDNVTDLAYRSHYIGDADHIALSYMLYPQDTEFLHTLRYIGVDNNGGIFNAPRMKEVRYMRKHNFKSKQSLSTAYYREAKEKHFENMPETRLLGDKGFNNNFGWTINAYIEDEHGELRQQNGQELAFCNGCHKTVGSTFDQTFSFPRKVDGLAGWGYINLKNQQDVPNIGEQQGEFLTYFQRVGGGDEFRQNQEMLARWFDSQGHVDTEKVLQANSVYELITPSARRALDLNKAYLSIVKEQSFIFGRDATLTKATNVLQTVDDNQAPLAEQHRYQWDMRLNWQTMLGLNVAMSDQP